jgi:hypothetical protein
MLNVMLAALLPLMLVFGLYHLFTWFNLFGVNGMVHWKRVGLVAAISHFLLLTGFFIFNYFDWQANRPLVFLGMNYSTFLFNHSDFWRLLMIFDTVPALGILAAFSLMDRAGVSTFLFPVALTISYLMGTVQWYFVGGGIGALLERIWEGLKTGEEGEEWFQ